MQLSRLSPLSRPSTLLPRLASLGALATLASFGALGTAALLAAPAPAHAAPKVSRTLCTGQEQVLLSCPVVRGKMVSLCASTELSATSGTMQYRFGMPGKTPELVYPANPAAPRDAFRYVENSGGKWTTNQVSFQSGGYTYVVFMHRSAFDSNGGGVLVRKDGAKVADLTCSRDVAIDKLYSLDELGMQKGEEVDVSEPLEKAGL